MNLNWLNRSPARTRRPARPVPPDWVNARVDQPPGEPDERPCGCGWFDSSHELNRGLQVTEISSPEPVANEVPLGWWLDWQTGPLPHRAPKLLQPA
jgi:hypothetical protein